MRGFNLKFIIVVLVCLPLISAAEIYQWVDAKGITHFSEQPHSGAVMISLPSASGISTRESAEVQKSQAIDYSLKIINPTNEETIHDNQGLVNILIYIKPTLLKTDHLILLFDGVPINIKQQTTFQLQQVEPGAHSLQVELMDSNEKLLKSSDKIIFYLHKTRMN